MTTDVENLPADKGRRKPIRLRAIVLRALRAVLHWSDKRRSRQVLSELTDQRLRDIGLTRSEARVEVNKSWFWG
jgi:uncharacterized protein YjiS (DUF1127 family)